MKAKDVIKDIEEGFDDNEQIADAVEWVEDAANRLAEFEQDNHMQAIKIEKLQAELANERHLSEGMTKAMQSYRDELAALKAEQGWLGIESSPKDGTFVLVIDSEYGDHSGAFVAQYSQHSFSGSWLTSHTPHVVRPTHWMPLPTPPQEQSHEN